MAAGLIAAAVLAAPSGTALANPPKVNFDVTPKLALMLPICFGQWATISGTAGSDTIHGTPGDDVILGNGGNDLIYGEGGKDVICGGSGNDSVWGDDTNQSSTFGWDNKLSGGTGGDVVHGDGGSDTMTGGTGNDWMYGNHGADTMQGGNGDDFLNGGEGNDFADGEADNDTLKSNDTSFYSQFNFIYGGTGADKIYTKQGLAIDSGDAGSGNDGCKKDGGDSIASCNYSL